jgi:hypothetical protein
MLTIVFPTTINSVADAEYSATGEQPRVQERIGPHAPSKESVRHGPTARRALNRELGQEAAEEESARARRASGHGVTHSPARPSTGGGRSAAVARPANWAVALSQLVSASSVSLSRSSRSSDAV